MTVLTILTVTALLGGTTSLTITPEHAPLGRNNDSVRVMCEADTTIARCQVKVCSKPAVDLSRGSLTNLSGYRYQGDGLEAGQCGATIAKSLFTDHWDCVQCRVRSEGDDWRYAAMSVTKGEVYIPRTTAARQVWASPGGNINLVFETEDHITNCWFLKEIYPWIDTARYSICDTTADSFCYYGKGINQKQCGITVRNITESFNTRLTFSARTRLGDFYDFIQVIVNKPPHPPVLTGDAALNVDGTVTVVALCTVTGSRPAANITWMLGDKVVTDGHVVSVTSDEWVDPWSEQTTVQQLTLNLDHPTYNRELWCVAHHVELLEPLRSNKLRPLPPMKKRPGEQATLIPGPPDQLITCLGQAAKEEQQLPLSHMEELHKLRLTAETDNALAARLNIQTAMLKTEEHQQRMSNMAELHRMQKQLEVKKARIVETYAKQAEEELAYQREFHKNESQQLQP